MADYGLKVSLPGKDISSTEPRDFVFDSNNDAGNVMIVLKAGSTATVPASSHVDVTIAHNLGYIPAVMLYMARSPGFNFWRLGIPLYGGYTIINNDPAYTYVDSTNFKFRIGNNTGSEQIVSFYYFILGDTAN